MVYSHSDLRTHVSDLRTRVPTAMLGYVEMSSVIVAASTYIDLLPNEMYRPTVDLNQYAHHGFVVLFQIGHGIDNQLTLTCRNGNDTIRNNILILDERLNRLDGMQSDSVKKMYINSQWIACSLIHVENNVNVVVDTGNFYIQANTLHYLYATNSYHPNQFFLKMSTRYNVSPH